MRNVMGVLVVLAVSGWAACAARTRGPEDSARPGEAAGKQDAPADTSQCADDPCPGGGGTSCLDLAVQLNSSGKKSFNPPSGNKGWRMCPGQELVVASQLTQGLCVELRDLQSSADGGVVALQPLTGGSNWTLPSLSPGAYCLSICNDDHNHCTQGCQQSACTSDDQTIRGNLDVGTKGPTDPDDKH